MSSIYLLRDPRTGDVRYVGQSVFGEVRLNSHLRITEAGGMNPVHCWIRKLVSMNFTPEWELQEDVSREDVDEAEVWYIAAYRAAGCKLLNVLEGGKGWGAHMPAENKAKISAARTGMKFTAEHCANIRAGGVGNL